MTDWNQVTAFMARVVPWPVNNTGYVNWHWSKPDLQNAGEFYYSGKPFQTVASFIKNIQWAITVDFHGHWFCTSLQSEVKRNTNGKYVVKRSKQNALMLKAIWIDIDVKPSKPDTHYVTFAAALDALDAFIKVTGLPAPTAIVRTGGGFHVYWISERAMVPDEWQRYANGLKALLIQHQLKCDVGLTTDSARILRVPGTLNNKTVPAREVKLLHLAPTDYNFAGPLGFLTSIAPVTPAKAAAAPFQLPANFVGVTPILAADAASRAALGSPNDSKMPPMAFEPVIRGCAFVREALRTGGKDYDQPQWNLTTLLATFMEEGNKLAHAMGNQHPDYTAETTEALWDRKLRERETQNIGWPSCSAIQAAGCKACALCPHFSKGKSPLNLTTPVAVTATVKPLAGGGRPLSLPRGYSLNKDGIICVEIEEESNEGTPGATMLLPLFKCKLSAPWAQRDPEMRLNFITSTDKGNFNNVSIAMKDMGFNLYQALLDNQVKPNPQNKRHLEQFTMSWLEQLHAEQEATQALPFGWWFKDGSRKGFVFGNTIMKADGTEAPAGFNDARLAEYYKPTGSLSPWLDACRMITDQKRPDLDAIVAVGFGAPLMFTSAEDSSLISAWGDSGSGKSSAGAVMLSIWGHPKLTMETKDSTMNSVMKKMGVINNLPIFWDEVGDEDAASRVYSGMFAGTQGVDKNRLHSTTAFQARGTWQTLLMIAGNHSFRDFTLKKSKTNSAGLKRIFEFFVRDRDPNGPGQLNGVDAARIIGTLKMNHGMMGMQYAKMLGSDPAAIDKEVLEIYKSFDVTLQPRTDERFWRAAIGCIMGGAVLGNRMGCEFDLDALREFLIATYLDQRERCQGEYVSTSSERNAEELLTDYLRQRIGQTIHTDVFPAGPGGRTKPAVLRAPDQRYMRQGVVVQWAVDARVLRISRKDFCERFLDVGKVSNTVVLKSLTEVFGMTWAYSKLAGGTTYNMPQERILSIPVPAGSPFEEMMHSWSNTADIVAANEAAKVTALAGNEEGPDGGEPAQA